MQSKGKSMFLAAIAIALLAVPISANAAQRRQQVSMKTAAVYIAGARVNGTNAGAAEDFQNNFSIDY